LLSSLLLLALGGSRVLRVPLCLARGLHRFTGEGVPLGSGVPLCLPAPGARLLLLAPLLGLRRLCRRLLRFVCRTLPLELFWSDAGSKELCHRDGRPARVRAAVHRCAKV